MISIITVHFNMIKYVQCGLRVCSISLGCTKQAEGQGEGPIYDVSGMYHLLEGQGGRTWSWTKICLTLEPNFGADLILLGM